MKLAVHSIDTADPTATEDLEAAVQTFRCVPNFLGGPAEVPIAPRAHVVDAMSLPVPYPVRCSESGAVTATPTLMSVPTG